MKALTAKRNVAIIAILFSPSNTAGDLTSQLHSFFNTQLAGVSGETRALIRTVPGLLPPCGQPLLSMSNNSHLWSNVNVSARCGNDKRYLQVNVQVIGNYVVAAMPIVRGGKLEAGNVKPKRERLDTLPPCTILDINQLTDAVSLRDLSPDQPIQLTQFRQTQQVEAGQRVNVIASDDGSSANAEGQAPNNAAVTQNTRVCMISRRVVSGVADADGNILVSL